VLHTRAGDHQVFVSNLAEEKVQTSWVDEDADLNIPRIGRDDLYR
jgi:hypothetical protein